MPKVSVCVPAYNAAGYLSETLQGILNQTFRDFEVIIGDDCSSDETFQIAQSFDDERILCFRNEKNLGWIGNTNACLKKAAGQYVCVLNADDGWQSSFLETMTAILDRHPTVGFAFSSTHHVNDIGEILGLTSHFDQDCFFSGEDFFRTDCLLNVVETPGVMVRRECYQRIGLYDSTLRFMADWEMWLRVSLYYDVFFVSSPLAFWRRHGENRSDEALLLDHFFREEWYLLHKIFSLIPEEKKYLKSLWGEARLQSAKRLYGCSLCRLAGGNVRLFRKQATLAVKMHPKMVLRNLAAFKIALSYFGNTPFRFLRKMKRWIRPF